MRGKITREERRGDKRRGEEVWEDKTVEQPSTEQNKSGTKQSRCRKKKQSRAEQKQKTTGRERTELRGSRAEQRERGRETTAELRRTKQCAADHSEANTWTEERGGGGVFWDKSSCHKLHCYLKAVSSGETNAKASERREQQAGAEMTSKE